jgi:membrane fusion protein (multidrug efflux system)
MQMKEQPMNKVIKSAVLLTALLGIGGALAAWKYGAIEASHASSSGQPEPVEAVTAATAVAREHRSATTAIGTVLALRSVTLRNELPGTVRLARLVPGHVVEAGTVLVALDVSVEEAELRALEAQAALAQTTLARVERMAEKRAVSAIDLDNARAERQVALAQVARTKAVIARKTIRAPFRARVGIADVHPGQFLESGSVLTTLQGVEEAANVDFAVAQSVAATLREGQPVSVTGADESAAFAARIVAVDSRVDPATRNATVRARVEGASRLVAPGSSVRVQVPVGPARSTVVVPASALRKGPGGDHVFVIANGKDGKPRAQLRPVQSGPIVGDEVVILDGLAVGEQVAASGSFKLRESALVSISNKAVVASATQASAH